MGNKIDDYDEDENLEHDARGKIIPRDEDFAAIEKSHGALPLNASDAQHAERYRLVQAQALLRAYQAEKAKPAAN